MAEVISVSALNRYVKNLLDVNIRRIRMKIEEEPSKPHYITTIWGYGYKWNDK